MFNYACKSLKTNERAASTTALSRFHYTIYLSLIYRHLTYSVTLGLQLIKQPHRVTSYGFGDVDIGAHGRIFGMSGPLHNHVGSYAQR